MRMLARHAITGKQTGGANETQKEISAAEKLFAAQSAKLMRQRAKAIHLIVEVEDKDTAVTFKIPCGKGDQNVKWLALVVAQRIANFNPKGSLRRREPRRPIGGVFSVPGEIIFMAQLIDPMAKLNKIFVNGDVLKYRAGGVHERRGPPKMPVAKYTAGLPQTYMSPFSQSPEGILS